MAIHCEYFDYVDLIAQGYQRQRARDKTRFSQEET